MDSALPNVVARPFPGRVTTWRPVHWRLRDFIHFSQRQYDCLDYDPFHPLLWHLQKGLDTEDALWSSTLYMAWYNIGSAHIAFCNSDPLKLPPEWCFKLPVGTQRRNLRGGKVKDHLESFIQKCRKAGSIKKYLTRRFTDTPGANWPILKDQVQGVWGNGRWSTYTTSELYQKVNKLPVKPTDIMNEGSTGPRTGLCYMYGFEPPRGDRHVPMLDELSWRFFNLVRNQIETNIPYLDKGHYDLGMVESQLCDFNSLRKGRYYIGRDIDRDQDRLRSCSIALKKLGKKDKRLRDVWKAREAVFDKRYLGEFGGWPGRTDLAKTYYLKTGKIADHAEIRKANGNLF